MINGDWKISIPGEYNVAGTKLLYRRSADTWESFEVPGPTREDLHLMVRPPAGPVPLLELRSTILPNPGTSVTLLTFQKSWAVGPNIYSVYIYIYIHQIFLWQSGLCLGVVHVCRFLPQTGTRTSSTSTGCLQTGMRCSTAGRVRCVKLTTPTTFPGMKRLLHQPPPARTRLPPPPPGLLGVSSGGSPGGRERARAAAEHVLVSKAPSRQPEAMRCKFITVCGNS